MRLNWGVGGNSVVGPISHDYGSGKFLRHLFSADRHLINVSIFVDVLNHASILHAYIAFFMCLNFMDSVNNGPLKYFPRYDTSQIPFSNICQGRLSNNEIWYR